MDSFAVNNTLASLFRQAAEMGNAVEIAHSMSGTGVLLYAITRGLFLCVIVCD